MHRKLIPAAVAAAFAVLSVHPAIAAPAPAAAMQQPTTQLPRGVAPTHYDVSITPDAKAGTFAGHVVVDLTVQAPTATITLNALDVKFSAATLTPAAGGTAQSAQVVVDANAQTATFTFAQPIAKGAYKLALDYTGTIGTQAVGLFSLDYDSPQGKQRALYTQFENSDARRMIPSWDEPAYKATFALSAVVPTGQMAVSNMPITKEEDLGGGKTRVTFAATPKMSTYLLFFGLGDFERARMTVDGVELGVVTRKGGAAQAQFALDSSKVVLREYNDYFGVRYPLPKLDNVAGPGRSQFFGAMENWGAIFTFEYAMLVDPSFSTQADRQEVFATAAHEMAHQWFGDLVTMSWWDDLWLNEGFASWMEGRTTARLHPEWNTALEAVNSRDGAMYRDALATTHPIVQHIQTVEQASQAFDAITYQKGEAVIRMLEGYVGENAWRSGVRAYMKAHAYGNTVSDDLWRSVEKAARKPITAIAHDFTLQPGVPLIRVEDVSCKNGATVVKLAQGEYSRDQPDKKPLSWRVPVIAQTLGSGKQGRAIVTGGKGAITLPGCGGAVVVNAGQSGYYRTLYAPKQFAELASGFDKLAPVDQIGMLVDSWALGLAGMQNAASFLDLAAATPLSADPQVWRRIARVFSNIHGLYNGDPARQKRFDNYAIARLAPVMAQVGWITRPGEATPIANLRESLITTLGELGDPTVVGEARRRYAASGSDPEAVPGPLRKVILAVVAQHADAPTWDKLHAAAVAEKTPLIKDRLYEMLAAAEDKALAQRALDLALTDEPGATNSAGMLARVAENHPDMAYDFAIKHIEQVNARVDATSRSRYFPRLAYGSYDPAMIAKLNEYAGANLAPTSRGDVATAIAAIRDRIKVRSERLPQIDAWLASHSAD
ncbi:M1 family metallopeptidase [Massilia solisilvae]|uniref:Aminopeptidase n=1 Tax=Massilia solisilvae TaxID=1811225 RepID=A0ABT2BGX5_9BURK|nr:M1 family metallopeptidase [Massilia solisilvae]MCS0607766.1 M1 family metallopeptidase [Massilia solisilvae]